MNKITMKTLNESSNFELEKLCNRLNINLIFIGCKDELTSLKSKKNGCYIINMLDEKKAESYSGHWVAFFKTSKDSIYFDSYGHAPPLSVLNFLKGTSCLHKLCKNKVVCDSGNKIIYNDAQLQFIDDAYCGHISVLFLYWISKMNLKMTLENRLIEFHQNFSSTNLKLNKKMVLKLFKNIE